MVIYRIGVIDTLTIPAGVALKLTPAQAEARRYALEPYGDAPDVFVATQPMQFKAGESVDIAGDLPKCLVPAYDLLRAAQPEKVKSGRASKTEPKPEAELDFLQK